MALETESRDYIPAAKCPVDNCIDCPFQGKVVVYGPMLSRRRGLSLGINLYPGVKFCNFNCIYCYLAVPYSKDKKVLKLIKPKDLEAILNDALKNNPGVQSVDFVGNGEPTLHPKFLEYAKIARKVVESFNKKAENKKKQGKKISLGIFTNSTNLRNKKVLKALGYFDHIEAKLDTSIPEKFRKINFPITNKSLDEIIEDLRYARSRFKGVFDLQVMLLKYKNFTNCSKKDALEMAKAIRYIQPNEVHLYTAYRKSKNPNIKPLSRKEIEKYAKVLRGKGIKAKTFT